MAKATAATLWSANGLWDPEVAFGGHQPLYFDDMMNLYANYYCVASRIEVVFSFPNSTDTRSYHCGVAIRKGSTISAQPHVYAENGGCKSFVHCQNNGTKTLSLSYYPGKTYGLDPKDCRNMPEMWGDVTRNPSGFAPAFHIFVGNASESAQGATITVSLKIQYDTIFFNTIQQAPNLDKEDTFPEEPEMVTEEQMVSVPASMMARMGLA
jgi:hypothetical protein